MCKRTASFVYFPWMTSGGGRAVLDSIHLDVAGNVCKQQPTNWLLKAGVLLGLAGLAAGIAALIRCVLVRVALSLARAGIVLV